MIKTKFAKLIAILFVPLLMGQACSIIGGSKNVADGGVWFSGDRGETWSQRSFVGKKGEKEITLNNLNINIMKFHPTDSRRIYISTDAGVYATIDGGDKWSDKLLGGAVYALALDPNDTNTMFVSKGNRILKTEDDGANWSEIYVEARGAIISQIAVDILDSSKVYAGMNTGDVIASIDGGKTWHWRVNVGGNIRKIVMSPYDSDVIFIGTSRRGIVASFDGGYEWKNLSKFYNTKEYPGSMEFKDLIYDETRNGSLLYASRFGLLWTNDSGRTWSPVNLVTPEGSVSIGNLAMNSNNPDEIYYTTGNLLNRTFDGGKNWSVKKLPSSRNPTALLVDFFNPDNIYLGVRQIKKRRFGG